MPDTCVLAVTGPDLALVVIVGLTLLAAGLAAIALARTGGTVARGGAAFAAVMLIACLGLAPGATPPAHAAECPPTSAPAEPTPTPTPTTCASDLAIDFDALTPSLQSQGGTPGVAGIDDATWNELIRLGGTMRHTESRHQDSTLRWFEEVDSIRVTRGTAPFAYVNSAWTETFTVSGSVRLPVAPVTYDSRTNEEYEALRRASAAAAGVVDYNAASYEWAEERSFFEVTLSLTVTDSCGTEFIRTYTVNR